MEQMPEWIVVLAGRITAAVKAGEYGRQEVAELIRKTVTAATVSEAKKHSALREEIKARLGDHLRYLEGNAKTGGSTLAWMTGVAADIRAALERDDGVRRLIDMAGDWTETDPSLRSTACIEVALDHAKELDSEVVALRQRVEELERSFGLLDQAATDYRRSRDTAEAKLARCVEAGGHLRGFAAGTDLGRAYIEDWDAALAAAKGE